MEEQVPEQAPEMPDEQKVLLQAYKLAAADRDKRYKGYQHDMALAQEAACARWGIKIEEGRLTILDPEQ